jgi:hypothetical protein
MDYFISLSLFFFFFFFGTVVAGRVCNERKREREREKKSVVAKIKHKQIGTYFEEFR